MKPIVPIVAFTSNQATGNLVLNTPFTVIHSIGKPALKRVKYYSENELTNSLPPSYLPKDVIKTDHNVIILILESFSAEFIGHLNNSKGFTPFLDSLAKDGVFFKNCFSNGRTSQQAVPAILAGLPPLMDETIITSAYQSNDFFSLFNYLKQYGYESYFFHGGKNGTMGFDRFTKKLGIKYFGLNEYPDKSDFDGHWGIYDEPYLLYCANKLNEFKKPFIATIFTLSSHQPYPVPEKYKNRFNKGTHQIHNSVAYTDNALLEFFSTMKKMDWYNNTLFFITADHVHSYIEKNKNDFVDFYRIPFVIFYPNQKLEIESSIVTQQLDILPSISDFLGVYPDNMPKIGKSIFSELSARDAITYQNNSYYLFKDSTYIKLINNKFIYYDQEDNKLPSKQINKEDKIRLKAYIQYFTNNMINNSFTRPVIE